MSKRGSWRSSALLALLPSAVFAAGIALTRAEQEFVPIAAPGLWIAMSVATVSPLVAILVLRLVARDGDTFIVAIAGMLTAIGTTALLMFSSAPGVAGTFYTAVATRHGLFVGGGFVALVCGAITARRIDVIRRFPVTLLAAALGLTVLTVVLGETVNGARLWLEIGSVRFQPSEVSRLLIAAFAAVVLYDRRNLVAASWRVGAFDLPPAPYLMPLAGAVLGAGGVLVFQNDLGMAALVVLGSVAAVLGVLSSRQFVVTVLLLMGGTVVGAYLTVARLRDRVSGWLDPWQDPAGRGFQIIQADYGLAAGGLVGDGVSSQARNIPEVHTDFIGAGVAGQSGWLVAVALLTLAALLVCRCVLCALRAADGFGALLGLSLSALIGIQVILITGGSLRVLPLTGLTFPLVSYGGTSMIVTMFALGLIVGIGAEPHARLG